MNKNIEESILHLVNVAAKIPDIQKNIVEAVFSKKTGTDIFNLNIWGNLSPEADKIMFGTYSTADEEEQPDVNCIYYHPKAVDLLIQKVLDEVLKKL